MNDLVALMDIDEHRIRPEFPIDQHVKLRVVELGRMLDSRIAIYLDVRYWILLRKAALGLENTRDGLELLDLLRQGVTRGRLFCPVSESVFLELLKQSDASSRVATARLIDELSLGVTLLVGPARFATELAHFIYFYNQSSADLHPIRHLVWSKLAYILGFVHPTDEAFDVQTERAVQKACFDHMWTIPLATMIEMIKEVPDAESLKLDDIATKLNDGAARHAAEIRSFKQVWTDELSGVADLCADTAAEIISEMGEKQGAAPILRDTPQWMQCRSMCANIIFHALKSKPQTRLRLPSLYIEACLHAAVRWDKQRPLTGNDLYDFNHASAALGYCRAFLTVAFVRSRRVRNVGMGGLVQ